MYAQGHEIVDLTIGMKVYDLSENVGDMGLRIDTVEFDEVDGSRFQRHTARPPNNIPVGSIDWLITSAQVLRIRTRPLLAQLSPMPNEERSLPRGRRTPER